MVAVDMTALLGVIAALVVWQLVMTLTATGLWLARRAPGWSVLTAVTCFVIGFYVLAYAVSHVAAHA